MTINDPNTNKVAHGAWISGLITHTIPNVKPVKPFPLVFSDTDQPVKDYPNIFFPANVVTVNRDSFFGKEHDTAVVNLGKFFPNATGDLGHGAGRRLDRPADRLLRVPGRHRAADHAGRRS